LAHPGDQELFLGGFAIEPLDFTFAGHAYMRFHLGDPAREQQVCWSLLDVGCVRDGEKEGGHDDHPKYSTARGIKVATTPKMHTKALRVITTTRRVQS